MADSSATRIDESALTKGQRRKLNALHKSVGDEIGEQTFAAWLSSQSASAGAQSDENATLIVDTLWPLVQQGTRWRSRAAAICSDAAAAASSSRGRRPRASHNGAGFMTAAASRSPSNARSFGWLRSTAQERRTAGLPAWDWAGEPHHAGRSCSVSRQSPSFHGAPRSRIAHEHASRRSASRSFRVSPPRRLRSDAVVNEPSDTRATSNLSVCQ